MSTGNGSLSAVNGNITINSQSSEKVDTQAVSVGGSKEQNSQESQTVGGVKDKITALLNGSYHKAFSKRRGNKKFSNREIKQCAWQN